MSILYTAGWDMTAVDFELTFISAGQTTFTIKHTGSGESNTYYLTDYDSNSADLYSHLEFRWMDMNHDRTESPLLSDYADDPLADILEEALNAAASAESWGGTFTVTFSTTTGKYTISHSALSFAIGGAGEALNVLGYVVASSTAASHTSIVVSAYAVLSTLDNVSRVSDEYEQPGVASFAVSDGGQPIGMARSVPIINMDWHQPFETHANTHKRKALYEDGYLMPWTFQHFFEHCRTVYPFVVYTQDFWTGFYPVFHLREDGAHFMPERAIPDYDGYWHIPFRAYLYGWYDA